MLLHELHAPHLQARLVITAASPSLPHPQPVLKRFVRGLQTSFSPHSPTMTILPYFTSSTPFHPSSQPSHYPIMAEQLLNTTVQRGARAESLIWCESRITTLKAENARLKYELQACPAHPDITRQIQEVAKEAKRQAKELA